MKDITVSAQSIIFLVKWYCRYYIFAKNNIFVWVCSGFCLFYFPLIFCSWTQFCILYMLFGGSCSFLSHSCIVLLYILLHKLNRPSLSNNIIILWSSYIYYYPLWYFIVCSTFWCLSFLVHRQLTVIALLVYVFYFLHIFKVSFFTVLQNSRRGFNYWPFQRIALYLGLFLWI